MNQGPKELAGKKASKDFRGWVDAGVELADQQPGLRELMRDAFGIMHESSWDHEATRDLSPVLDEATDKILTMLGPLAPGDGCLLCGNPARHDVDLCEDCVKDHGAEQALWPAWIKRLADDRAARAAAGRQSTRVTNG